MTRNGKIARLPHAVREELNRRLQNGEEGKQLARWLNGLPQVQAIVKTEFDGKAIREQNLSEWKQGGYRDWVAQQEALELVQRLSEDATAWQAEGRLPLTDILALWLAARYAAATQQISETEGPKKWQLLRQMCWDVVELRRGDHSAQRLQIERERLATEARDADMKWKRKVIVGLETLMKFTEKNPKAKAAMDELVRETRHPFDPTESE